MCVNSVPTGLGDPTCRVMGTGTTVTSFGMIYSRLKFKWAQMFLGCTYTYLSEMNQTESLEILLIH